MAAAQEFVEFATTASPRLRRMAFLLCGDWHAAEDLVQTTLALATNTPGRALKAGQRPFDIAIAP